MLTVRPINVLTVVTQFKSFPGEPTLTVVSLFTAIPRIVGASDHDNLVKMAAEVGAEVVLPCEAQGSPTPLVTWNRNGHPIPPVTAG